VLNYEHKKKKIKKIPLLIKKGSVQGQEDLSGMEENFSGRSKRLQNPYTNWWLEHR
jgi:hypothetical protein